MNDYKLVTDTPVYVQAVKSGKQLSDVSAHGDVLWTAVKTGHHSSRRGKPERVGSARPFLTGKPELVP